MHYFPDPFVIDPFDDPEVEREKRSIDALTRLIADVHSGKLSEDVFFARSRSGFSDLKPETGRHWLWRVHHRPHEVWKCLGRPNWSVAAYRSWREQYFATPEAKRHDRNGHPKLATFPKKAAGLKGLRHEHVVPMGLMLRSLLDGVISPEKAIKLNQDAIITIEEDHRLDKSGHPDLHDPWRRYAGSGVRFIPNPTWDEAHRSDLARYDLVASEGEVELPMAVLPPTEKNGVVVPAQLLLAYLAGRIPLLQFGRHFGWAEEETELINPFMQRAKDGLAISSVAYGDDEFGMPVVKFGFQVDTGSSGFRAKTSSKQ
jgi:hypothetical protein